MQSSIMIDDDATVTKGNGLQLMLQELFYGRRVRAAALGTCFDYKLCNIDWDRFIHAISCMNSDDVERAIVANKVRTMELIAKKWNKGRNMNLSHFRDSSYFKTAAELIRVSDVPILWHVLQRNASIRVIQVVLNIDQPNDGTQELRS